MLKKLLFLAILFPLTACYPTPPPSDEVVAEFSQQCKEKNLMMDYHYDADNGVTMRCVTP